MRAIASRRRMPPLAATHPQPLPKREGRSDDYNRSSSDLRHPGLDPGSTAALKSWIPDQACPELVEGSGMTRGSIPPCGAAMGRGTVREANGGGAATVAPKPLRQHYVLALPHGFATGRWHFNLCRRIVIGGRRPEWVVLRRAAYGQRHIESRPYIPPR